jgi:hypothetical protein
MTIASMAAGDTVVKQFVSYTSGAIMGNTPTATDGASLDCNVQSMSVGEAKQFAARGEVKLFNVFFATDPALTTNNRLKWIKTNGNGTTFATPRILKVLATDEERNPDGSEILYIAQCELVTTEALS